MKCEDTILFQIAQCVISTMIEIYKRSFIFDNMSFSQIKVNTSCRTPEQFEINENIVRKIFNLF